MVSLSKQEEIINITEDQILRRGQINIIDTGKLLWLKFLQNINIVYHEIIYYLFVEKI